MVSFDILVRGTIAIAIGLLIGLEREHHSSDTLVLAGIRTYPIVALFGFVSGYLSYGENAPFPYMVYVSLSLISIFALAMIYIRFSLGHYGITSPLALVITFISGMLLGMGESGLITPYTIVAVFLAVAVTFLLIEKSRLHTMALAISSSEITSATEFLLILFVFYPLAVSIKGPVDPYGIIGPDQIIDPGFLFTIVIIVSLITFTSYVLILKYGALYGIYISSFLGGLMSSEATTSSISNMVKENSRLKKTALGGIYLALVSMYIRDLVLVLLSDPSFTIIRYIIVPFAIIIVLLSILVYIISSSIDPEVTPEGGILKSPFAVDLALKFAAVFTVLTSITFLMVNVFGGDFIYLVSLGGWVSSSAVAASVAHEYVPTASPEMYATTIILGTTFAIGNKFFIIYPISRELFESIKMKLFMVLSISAMLSIMPFFFHL